MSGAITASSQEAADAGVRISAHRRERGRCRDRGRPRHLRRRSQNTGFGGYGGYMLVQRSGEPVAMHPVSAVRAVERCARDACARISRFRAGMLVGTECRRRARACRSEFGTLPWTTLVQPAIELARCRRGGQCADAARAPALSRASFVTECFVLDEKVAGPGARVTFRQPALAATLETLADRGPEWFYEGPLGRAAQRASRDAGSISSLDDWIRQRGTVEMVVAPALECSGLRISAAPLGLSGSACLFAMFAAASRISQRMPLTKETAMAELASAMSSIWQYRFATPRATTSRALTSTHG